MISFFDKHTCPLPTGCVLVEFLLQRAWDKQMQHVPTHRRCRPKEEARHHMELKLRTRYNFSYQLTSSRYGIVSSSGQPVDGPTLLHHMQAKVAHRANQHQAIMPIGLLQVIGVYPIPHRYPNVTADHGQQWSWIALTRCILKTQQSHRYASAHTFSNLSWARSGFPSFPACPHQQSVSTN